MIAGHFYWRRLLAALVFSTFCLASVSGASDAYTPAVLAQKSSVNWHAVDMMDVHPEFLLIQYTGSLQPVAPSGPVMLQHLHTGIGAEVTKQYRYIPWIVVRLPENVTLPEAALHYAKDPAVVFVEPNFRMQLFETRPDDARYGELWGMERIRAPEAWSISTESPEVVVAVIDTGIRYTHQDLRDNMWVNPNPGDMNDLHGATFISGGGQMTNGDPNDTNGHGTHVAGTIGAVGNNGVGVAGVTWNVQLMALNFLHPNGGWTADAIAAIEYAIEHGAHLSNNSWGMLAPTDYHELPALEHVIQAAADANQLFVAAAGNDMHDNNSVSFRAYPASFDVDNIISVASITKEGVLSGFSNYGFTTVHIAAPGSDILSAWHTSNNAYNSISGTSMASPHVAGAAALLLGRGGANMPYADLRAAILDSARPNPALIWRVSTGGELDLLEALKLVGPSISLNRRAYQSTAIAEITLFEPTLPTNQASAQVAWRLEEDVLGSPMVITNGTLQVFREAPDSPIFTNTLDLAAIGAQEFQEFIVSYEDADGRVYFEKAPIDDTPPVIADVLLDAVSEDGLTLSWTTDEPAQSFAYVGTAVPPSVGGTSFLSLDFRTNHVLRADGLQSLTRYFALVEAEDYAGNRSSVPVPADLLDPQAYIDAGLATLTRAVVQSYGTTFERGASDWEAERLYGQPMWEYGETHFGVPTRMRGWATILHGNYPIQSHGQLTSPVIQAGARPVVELDHWWQFGFIRDLAHVEARTKHGPWHLIGQIPGGGSWQWQTDRMPLPGTFAHKPVQVRLRFESGSTARAGWYLDAVRVTELLDTGLVIADLQISDVVGGDGDGFPEPGETITIQPVLANFSDFARNGITGEVSVISSSGHAVTNFLQHGRSLTFDDLPALQLVTANASVQISLPETLHPESTLSLVFLLKDAAGRRTELTQDISVEPRVSLRGRLVDSGGVGVAFTRVELRRGAQTFTGWSDANGDFVVHGMLQRTAYTLEAGDQTRRVVMPEGDWHDYELILYGGPEYEGLEDEEGDAYVPTPDESGTEDQVLEPPAQPVSAEPVVLATTTVTGIVSVVTWSDDMTTSTIKPVSNATVIVENIYGGQIGSAATDEFGHYELEDVPDGPQWFRVIAPPDPADAEDEDDDDEDDDENGDDDEDDEEPPPPHPWYVPPAGRTVIVGTAETDVSVDFALTDYGFNVPYLQAVGVIVADENGNDILERGEEATIAFYLRNRGAAVSQDTIGLLATAWMDIDEVDDVMTVTQSNAWQSVDIYENGPIRYLKPSFEIKVHTNAPKNAVQRFTVVVEGMNTRFDPPTTLQWPFDFALQADGRIEVQSQVIFTDNPSGIERAARMQETRVRLTLNGESMTRRPNPDGTFVFRGPMLELGASGTIEITRLPEGFAVPDPIPIAPLTDDLPNVFIYVDPLAMDVALPAAVTIYEGQSTNVSFVVTNNTASVQTFDLAVRYHRLQREVQHAPAQEMMATEASEDEAPYSTAGMEDSIAGQETGEFVVRFASGTSRKEQAAILADAGLEAVFYFNSFPAALARPVSVTGDVVGFEALSVDSESDPRILSIVPDTVAKPYGIPPPNDEFFNRLYGLHNTRQSVGGFLGGPGTIGMDIRALEAWAYTTGSRDVVVGVVDSGILTTHPDLAANIWENPAPGSSEGIDGDTNGWNFVEWNSNAEDDGDNPSGHGTHVAGTIGAVGNNNVGVTGVAWDTQLMALRIFVENMPATSARIAKAIEYATENGAQVSNHSWGGPDASHVIYSAITNAAAHNHLVIAAAGNDALDLDHMRTYPAGYGGVLDNVITVAATDQHGELASFSNFGKNRVQIAAPGDHIYSTYVELHPRHPIFELEHPYYHWISGTSMAAPHVTGVAVLLWSLDPDAHYTVIRDAILQGVRKDSRLDGWVQTGGHLDAARAMRAMGATWLEPDKQQITLGPGDEEEITLQINDPAVLQARSEDYAATVILHATDNDVESVHVPVRVTVKPHLWVTYEDVRIENENDWPDGLAASPGDRVSLWVALRNRGSGAAAMNLRGELRATDGSIVDPWEANWPMLLSMRTEESYEPFEVVLDPGANDDVVLELDLYQGNDFLETVLITVPVLVGYHAEGQVVDADGTGVLARVEAVGQRGADSLTVEDGTFVLRGLVDGDYQLRVIPAEYTRLTNSFAIAGAHADLGVYTVSKATGTPATNRVETYGMLGGQAARTLTLVNDDEQASFAYSLQAVPVRRIALVSDGNALGHLVAPLTDMGFRVSHYTDNFARKQTFGLTYRSYQVEQIVRWTNQDAVFGAYDAIIADLSGPDGHGRLMTQSESSVLRNFMDRGGLVILTGRNPLSIPDNHRLASLMGIDDLDRSPDLSGAQIIAHRIFESPFVRLDASDQVASRSQRYDLATQVPWLSRVDFETELANKIVSRRLGAGLGYVWTGNHAAADWQASGVWLDVLRGLLWNALYADTEHEIGWIGLQRAGGAVTNLLHGMIAAMDADEIDIILEAGYPARAENQEAVLVILGAAAGADIKTVPLDFSIAEPVLRVFTSGVVTDWRNLPLQGDGGATSARYQVILTDVQGHVAEPGTDGTPGVGNQLLAAEGTGLPYGRFGTGGVPADAGKFNQLFRLPIDHADRHVFVRAWDSPTFDASIAYGDSGVFALSNLLVWAQEGTWAAGEGFGSWGVTNALHPDRDSNNNSIPDGWIIENALHLDPRDPVAALDSKGMIQGQVSVPNGRVNAEPRRVVVHDSYVFVLDTPNHRLLVHSNRWEALSDPFEMVATLGRAGGHPGSELGEFNNPHGLSIDPRPGVYRLAVADTNNDRIQLIDFDPDTGALTPVRALGSSGTGNGQLRRPRGVAMMPGSGDVFVADTGNHRMQAFRQNGNFWFGFAGSTQYAMDEPHGIAVDPDYGIFMADTQNHRILQFGFGGTGLQIIGEYGEADGQFARPTDVRIWRHEVLYGPDTGQFRRRLVITDEHNNAIQLHAMDGKHLLRIGKLGSQPGELRLPFGVFPVESSPYLYVADTGNRRIQHFEVVLDADGDGMDDFWEDRYGFDSSVNDAMEWSDISGLRNIAVYLVYAISGEDLLLDDDAEIPFTIVERIYPDESGPAIVHVQRSGSDPSFLELGWGTTAGWTYRVERTHTLGEPWQTVATYTATGAISSVLLPMDEDRGFFRIVVDE